MADYLDTSMLVALFSNDALTNRARRYLTSRVPVLVVSDFAAAEFASALARRVRIADLTRDEARAALANFDEWTAAATQRVQMAPADINTVERWLRRLDLTLRTPDALNIAIAQRVNATLVTFDRKMGAAARALGATVTAA